MNTQRIVIGADHAAVELKDHIAGELKASGAQIEDVGTFSTDSVDYPDIAARVAQRITEGTATAGVLLCGTGIGVSISANKIAGIRAAQCHDVTSARLARQHNDANIVCLGGRLLGPVVAMDIVTTFLGTKFEAGRHQRRLDKISDLENASSKVNKELSS